MKTDTSSTAVSSEAAELLLLGTVTEVTSVTHAWSTAISRH